jgi:hypothetical protein
MNNDTNKPIKFLKNNKKWTVEWIQNDFYIKLN